MPPFRYSMPVRFADVDHAGIVYYPVFFHYFHIAFEEFFRARMGGRAYVELLDQDRIGFPAVKVECEYKAPLRFGDLIEVEMSLARLGTRSMTLQFVVFRCPDVGGNEAKDAPRQIAAQGTKTCAIVDLDNFRAIELTDRLRQLFEPLLMPS